MSSQSNLLQELESAKSLHTVIRTQLLAADHDLDEQALRDTLEGATNLHEILSEVVRSALDDAALAEGLSTRLRDMKARQERLEERARRKREVALKAMSDFSILKLIAPEFTASIRLGAPTLEVVAEDIIPPAYWKPQPPKLDKQGLLAALKAGTAIDGVSIAPPQPQLSVRTK